MASTVNASQYAQAASTLDKLIADLKARIGVFLGNQKAIQDAMTVAKAIQQAASGAPKESAGVLLAKGEALLKIQADSEAQAQALLSQAADLKAKIGTPLYSFLNTSPMTWGYRQGELLADLLKVTASVGSAAASLALRIQKQNADVATLVKEVKQVEQAAAGTGVVPKISALLSGTVGSVSAGLFGGLSKALWPVAIVAAVAGIVYITAPGLLRGKK